MDATILVTSSGEEHFEFNVDPENYAIFAVREVSSPQIGSDYLSFYDNPSQIGVPLYGLHVLDTFQAHRDLGFIVRSGHQLGESTSTYVKVQWIENYQYRVEIENDTNSLELGETTLGSLNMDEIIDVYQVHLEAGITYNFTLNIGSIADFDLYLLYGDLASSKDYLAYSYTGKDKQIFHCPDETGYYCLVITNPAETNGNYNITASILDIDDNPFELAQLGWDSNTGTGMFSFNTLPYSYSVFSIRTINQPSSTFNPAIQFYDTPSRAGPPIITVRDEIDAGIGELLFIARQSSGSSFMTYVQVLYPDYYSYRVEVETGEIGGMALIETNSTVTGHMNVDETIDAYHVSMVSGQDYEIILEVPQEADFDLCLLKGDRAHSHNYERLVITDSAGTDEEISYTPAESGDYLILALNREGYSADYELTVKEYIVDSTTTSTISPTTTESITNTESWNPDFVQLASFGGAFALGIIIILVILRRRK